jgi:hypothetical protein
VNDCRSRRRILVSACLLLAAASPSFSQASKLINTKTLPVSFEVNRGQTSPHIDFVARAEGYTVYIRPGQATFRLNRSDRSNAVEKDSRENLETGINLVSAKEHPEVQPEDKLPGYSNFLFGPDPHKWITDVTHYAKIRYANVYPGIDVIYHGNQDHLENDFVVLPGANPREITFSFSNTRKPHLNKQGDLVLRLGDGEFKLQKPRAYQLIAGKEVEVAAAYVLRDGQAHFHLGRYAPSTPLIIDPVLVYSTFLGGGFGSTGNFQAATAAAVDASGNLYVVGVTDSSSFPVTPGVLGPSPASGFLRNRAIHMQWRPCRRNVYRVSEFG